MSTPDDKTRQYISLSQGVSSRTPLRDDDTVDENRVTTLEPPPSVALYSAVPVSPSPPTITPNALTVGVTALRQAAHKTPWWLGLAFGFVGSVVVAMAFGLWSDRIPAPRVVPVATPVALPPPQPPPDLQIWTPPAFETAPARELSKRPSFEKRKKKVKKKKHRRSRSKFPVVY